MKTAITRSLAIAALAAALPAAAQETPWYIGIAGGSARTSDDFVQNREGSVVNASNFRTSFDDNDGAYKIFGGWRINPYFSVEANYFDLGSVSSDTRFDTPGGGSGRVFTKRDVKGYGLDLLVAAPLGERFSVFGRVGAYRAESKADIAITGNVVFNDGDGGNSRSNKSWNNGTRAGVGLDWNFTRNATLRVEYERYFQVGNAFAIGQVNTTGEADIDVVSVGAVYRF